jgi:acyl-coenzyme A synthetase/AMP-(fatty) acid ligase
MLIQKTNQAAMEATLHTVPQNTDPDADVWLSTLSLGFFINAKLNMGLNILLGIPVVLLNTAFGPDSFQLIEKYRITFLFLPPPVAIAIAAASLPKTDVSSVKWLLSAGATMNEGVQRAVSERLNAHLAMEWGTAETLLIALQLDGASSPPGSCGKLVNGIEAMVIDINTGSPVGPGIEGELLVRNSAAKFAGYKANQAANQSTFDEAGWFHSGDYGMIDENNNVFIRDRIKELIRVGSGYGVHISATELESKLFEHPAVAEVIVTGVLSPTTHTEQPTAFVVLATEWKGKPAEALSSLQKLAAEKFVGLQSLTGGFIFITQFPHIGFKIDRRALKALAISQRPELNADLKLSKPLDSTNLVKEVAIHIM